MALRLLDWLVFGTGSLRVGDRPLHLCLHRRHDPHRVRPAGVGGDVHAADVLPTPHGGEPEVIGNDPAMAGAVIHISGTDATFDTMWSGVRVAACVWFCLHCAAILSANVCQNTEG
eukprot:EG_transcript_32259